MDYDYSWGVALTHAEARSLDKRTELLNEIVPKMNHYVKNYKDVVAGIFANQAEGGDVYVQFFAEADPDIKNKIISELDNIHKDKVKIVFKDVKYSLKMIEGFNQEVIERLKEENVNFSTSIDLKENRIIINLDKADSDQAKWVADVLPSDSYVIKIQEGIHKRDREVYTIRSQRKK